jgi:DNA-binding CsgD family transcriptional regulator/DNA-binding MarR family transcriptional regulator
MLLHNQDGIAAIAQRLHISPDQVHTALDTLSSLALVRKSTDVDGTFYAVRPQLGLQDLLAQKQAELAQQQERVEASRAAVSRLVFEYASQDHIERLEGTDQVRERLLQFTEEVKEEIVTFAPGGPQTAENMKASQPLNKKTLDRGVRMRTLYLDSIRNSRETVEYAEWLTQQGGEVRTVPSLPTRMIIVDRASAVVSIDSTDSSRGATILTANGTIMALYALFEITWAMGQPLGNEFQRNEHGLTAQEGMTLQLLSRGLTDERIAERLGVSSRTSRRIAADLMDRLQARSRFEAGVNAVRNNWLPLRP